MVLVCFGNVRMTRVKPLGFYTIELREVTSRPVKGWGDVGSNYEE
jgi:hypothetical protein